MAWEDKTLFEVPGQPEWPGFTQRVDLDGAGAALQRARELASEAKRGLWNGLPLSRQFANAAEIFRMVGAMFQYMNTPPTNSPLWMAHFSKWHGELLWNDPEGSGSAPGKQNATSLEKGPNVAFGSGGIVAQRVRRIAQRLGKNLGNGTHIIPLTIGFDGRLLSGPSGSERRSSNPQYDFSGQYSGAACCPFTSEFFAQGATPSVPVDDREIQDVGSFRDRIGDGPLPYGAPVVQQAPFQETQNDIPYLEILPAQPRVRTDFQVVPSGAVLQCGAGSVRPSGFISALDEQVPEGYQPPTEPQLPQYGWNNNACAEVPSGGAYNWNCVRWDDAPLQSARVLPAVRWSVEEAIDLVDALKGRSIWDHIVLARTNQMIEMVKRAKELGLPNATDPLMAPVAVMQSQNEAIAEFRRLSRMDQKSVGAITTDAIVGTVTGVLAAIPFMQVAAAAIAALYALGKLLASIVPLAVGYDVDMWGRVEPSVWTATIYDKPDQQMQPPEGLNIMTVGSFEDRQRLSGTIGNAKAFVLSGGTYVPPTYDPDATKNQQQGTGVSGTTLLVIGAAAGLGYWWWSSRNAAGAAPKKNPSRRR